MLDWKDYAFAGLLIALAFVACVGGYEAALAARDVLS